jgi:hypothetical protein
MKRFALFACIVAVAIGVSAQDKLDTSNLNDTQLLDDQGGPPMLGPAWAPGSPEYMNQLQQEQGLPNLFMYWHGGRIMPQANVMAIFWGRRWANNDYVDDKIAGLDTWYQGFGNSNYAATSNEYRGSNGQVTGTVNYNGHVVDTTQAASGQTRSRILAEVCKAINNTPDPSGNGYYPVYTDIPRPAGGIYCAYHSWGKCPGNNTLLQFAFFWSYDGINGGGGGKDACAFFHKDQEQGHSLQLATLSDYSGHELSEARTDPTSRGWFDLGGNENADKCLGVYAQNNGQFVPVTFSNGSQWIIQSEWSNLAYYYQLGIGRFKGCLQGQ